MSVRIVCDLCDVCVVTAVPTTHLVTPRAAMAEMMRAAGGGKATATTADGGKGVEKAPDRAALGRQSLHLRVAVVGLG